MLYEVRNTNYLLLRRLRNFRMVVLIPNHTKFPELLLIQVGKRGRGVYNGQQKEWFDYRTLHIKNQFLAS